MMGNELLDKISKWRKVAENQEDYFIKFALEYFTFNALLRIAYSPNRVGVRDRDLINKLKEDKKCREFVMSDSGIKRWIEQFKNELDKKALKNLSRNSDIRLSDAEDWNNFVEAVYVIRNNLFHGYKTPDDKRDQRLVEIGYHLLKGFNSFLVKRVSNHA